MKSPKGRKADRVVRYTAKDGTTKVYRYSARKAAPPPAAPPPADDLASLLDQWQRSPEWRKLTEGSRRLYAASILPLAKVRHIRARDIRRTDLLAVRDSIATARGDGAAINFIRAVSAMMSWAKGRGLIDFNPILGGTEGLHRGELRAWTEAEAELAMRDLPEPLRRAVVLALYTGQRRGDLCRLPWSAYDGQRIRLVQQKTKEPVLVPVHPRLAAELDVWAQHRTAITILTDRAGKPWNPSRLSQALPVALSRIGLPDGLNLHGLRKLMAIRLAEAGCSAHQIMAIGGWRTITMVAAYTRSVDRERLAGAAMVNLEAWDKRNLSRPLLSETAKKADKS